MTVFVLVTIDQGTEELLGVYSTIEKASAGMTAIAALRNCSLARFAHYPINLDELLVSE